VVVSPFGGEETHRRDRRGEKSRKNEEEERKKEGDKNKRIPIRADPILFPVFFSAVSAVQLFSVFGCAVT
jgi:hypothetical protein